MSKKYKMHVISGTHWDREWRHTAEQSKPRLVQLMDTMIDVLENNPKYKVFCLDGGMVVLEDYLTIRPENKQKLIELVQSGRIAFVNWYTLPDMFTVAPECLIRNIQKGREMAEEFGGTMSSGYTATSYGQTSQLPQLYSGFGINNAIFYRGTNKHLLKPLFMWEGADGSKIHMMRTFDEVTRTNWFFYVHQPLVCGKEPADLSYHYKREEVPTHVCDQRHYERGFVTLREEKDFARDKESLNRALGYIVDQAKPYMIGNNLLALNMEDNDWPHNILPEMIDAMNDAQDEVEIVQSSMDEFMDAVTSVEDPENLPVHKGELRYPAVEQGFNGLLGATHSSRVILKIKNEECETRLMYLAEPMATFDAMLGTEYPTNFLKRAWRHLLLNQAHDSICGAAVDQAHKDMMYNFSLARMVSEEITARATMSLIEKIDSASCAQENDHTITMFNTLPYDRQEVLQLQIDMPKSGAAAGVVDPCTGVGGGGADDEIKYFDIVDKDGNELEYKILSKEDINIAVEREMDTKGIKMPATRRRVLVQAKIPAMGYATYYLRPRGPKYVPHPEHGPDRKLIARENGVLENDKIKVTINCNGTFDLYHKETDRLMENQHYFSDAGQTGSAHMVNEPTRNPVITSHGCNAKVTMVDTNELRGIYKIEMEMEIPAAATLDSSDRLTEVKKLPITTWLTLEKDCDYLKVKTRLTNNSRDHKLKVHFPSKVDTDIATVESAWDIVRRNIRWTETGDNFEGFYPFQPMQNFVDLNDGKVGLAVLNKGLREYEINDDADRTISITLLRTQRAYMTANSDMIPEELEQYTGQHSLGTIEYQYALYPHTGDWDSGKVLQKAYEHKVSISAVQSLPLDDGDLPVEGNFFDITPNDKLMISALKQSLDGDGYTLRIWNTSDEEVDGVISTMLPVKTAERFKLDEKTKLENLSVKDGKIDLKVKPHKIETVILKQ